jgi:hypothetical protein
MLIMFEVYPSLLQKFQIMALTKAVNLRQQYFATFVLSDK